MPDQLTWSGARIPRATEPNDASQFLKDFGVDIDPHLVQWATSQSDRDTRFADLPANGLVACYQAKTIWMKTSGVNQWISLASDTGWVTAGFTFKSGFQAGGWNRIRNRNGVNELRIQFKRKGSTLNASSNGNIGDTDVCTIPAGFAPKSGTNRVFGIGGLPGGQFSCIVDVDNTLAIMFTYPNATIANGETFETSLMWLEG